MTASTSGASSSPAWATPATGSTGSRGASRAAGAARSAAMVDRAATGAWRRERPPGSGVNSPPSSRAWVRGRHATRGVSMTETAVTDSTALAAVDPEIARLVEAEGRRQFETVRLIASENYASRAVLEATGSVLTNKYSEGYPGKRYYEGARVVDDVESVAIRRAPDTFGGDHAT